MQQPSAQEAELLRHSRMLMHLLEKNGISLQQLETEGTDSSHLDTFIRSRPADSFVAAPAPTASEKPNA